MVIGTRKKSPTTIEIDLAVKQSLMIKTVPSDSMKPSTLNKNASNTLESTVVSSKAMRTGKSVDKTKTSNMGVKAS